ncbi:MAG: hypothetical protein ACKOS8_09095 [Gemmataceae bacterium]
MLATLNSRGLFTLMVAFALWTAGCGQSKVRVSGKLEWQDGKPASELAEGQVIFESTGSRVSARGVIAKDASFQINTEGPDDGVLPGDYQVAIVEHRPAPEGSTKLPPQHLKDKYYSFTTSGLTATVSQGKPVVLKLERIGSK